MFKKVLAISPHTDDVELACGATIAALLQRGVDVYYLALSDCRETLTSTAFPPETLTNECFRAVTTLGIKKTQVSILQHTNTKFCEEKRAIFESIENIKQKFNPDSILIPHLYDTHQDHKTVAEQALAVFRRNTTILCYEQPWNAYDFSPNFFFPLELKHLKKKLRALAAYETQIHLKRTYFTNESITSIARMRGLAIQEEYAEAFINIKYIARI